MKTEIRKYLPELLIIAAGMILFLPFIGRLHLFDWDEINFAESAREMIMTGDYSTVRINYLPFWEKPPLFIWMQALSMKIFGINEFAARFPNSLCGILTLLCLYRMGKRIYDRDFGLYWTMAYAGSILPFFYFKSGIIDPWFNLFIFLGIMNFIFMLDAGQPGTRRVRALAAGLFLGLAVLTKGPVGFLLFILTTGVYWTINRFRMRIGWKEALIFLMALILSGSAWFIIQVLKGNYGLILEFVQYQVRLLRTRDAGHGGFLLYHFLVLLLGVFPSSLLALKGFRRNYYDGGIQKKLRIWMVVLLLVVLVVFTAVKTKIVHYSSLAYFPITYLAAGVVYKIVNKHLRNYRWIDILIASAGFLCGMFIVAAPWIMMRKDRIIASGRITDAFALGNLGAPVKWTGYESLVGVVLIAGVVVYLVLAWKEKRSAYPVLFASVALFTSLFVCIFVPRVEGYTQKALVEFCEDRQGEDCYVATLRLKSYAPLFYTKKPVPAEPGPRSTEWLLKGPIDKPAYFITRNKSASGYLEDNPGLQKVGERNGYVFLKREVTGKNLGDDDRR